MSPLLTQVDLHDGGSVYSLGVSGGVRDWCKVLVLIRAGGGLCPCVSYSSCWCCCCCCCSAVRAVQSNPQLALADCHTVGLRSAAAGCYDWRGRRRRRRPTRRGKAPPACHIRLSVAVRIAATASPCNAYWL